MCKNILQGGKDEITVYQIYKIKSASFSGKRSSSATLASPPLINIQ
jgi:hypothetical protein